MKLSKRARMGLDWTAKEIEKSIVQGVDPVSALEKVGIEGLSDIYFFLEYLRSSGKEKLLKSLTTKK